jgi:flagellar motor switch protein FliM
VTDLLSQDEIDALLHGVDSIDEDEDHGKIMNIPVNRGLPEPS